MEQTIAIYARISRRDRQGGERSESINNQTALAEAWIAAQAGMQTQKTEKYHDDGYSGTNMNRPAFQKMLAGIFLGRIRVLVVKDFSRLSRNYLQLAQLLEMVFPRYPVRVVSLADGYDSAARPVRPEDNLKSLFYEYYCLDISRKTKHALQGKKEQGECAAARVPFGYRRCGGNMEICQEEAALVRRVFSLSMQGQSTPEIAGQISTRSGEKCEKRWSASEVWRMLHDPVYIGDFQWHKYENEYHSGFCTRHLPRETWRVQSDHHPAIISRAMFEENLRRHPTTAGYGKRRCARHLFHGLTKCGNCGKALCRHRTRREMLICPGRCGQEEISMEILWEICRQVLTAGEAVMETPAARRIFLQIFVRKILIQGKHVEIFANVSLENHFSI